MRQLLAAPFCLRSSLRRVAYRQDMPPPGGYPQMPWRRNIPQRGFGFIGVLVTLYAYYHTARVADQRTLQNLRESMLESQNQEVAMMPLFEAEIDRDEMRCLKEQIEGEAVNIVASGFDKYWKCGGYGIGDNGPATYWPSNGYISPYNHAIFKNAFAERSARTHSFSHQAMSINNAMYTGAGKFEHYGRGTDWSTWNSCLKREHKENFYCNEIIFNII